MKKHLLFLILSCSLGAQAQQFSFQMFFKDAIGNRDTLTLGYDTAATKLIDVAFGEVNIIGVPLDSVFDVRITDEWENRNGGGGTFHTKKQITFYDCANPWFNFQSIDIKAKHWPITATWDKTLFNSNCRKWSLFTSDQGDVIGQSNLHLVKLFNKDSVTFTTNQFQGFPGSFAYINNANDTIPVFWHSFSDSILFVAPVNELTDNLIEIKVFPNPSTNSISISLDKSFDVASILYFYNMYGQLVLSTKQKENIDVANLHAGLYLIRVADKYGRIQTVKFQKI